eukprot:scaffold80407_cov45-Prasinocladus_malaysianus.AAC.1
MFTRLSYVDCGFRYDSDIARSFSGRSDLGSDIAVWDFQAFSWLLFVDGPSARPAYEYESCPCPGRC